MQGRSVVIVGGTTGIGLSAARACLREGAFLTILGKEGDPTPDLGPSAKVILRDARQAETIGILIQTAVDAFGKIDALYHVVGGSGRRAGDGPLHEISDVGWDQTIDLNLKSLFLSNRAAVQQYLRQASGGSILNVSSVLGDSPSTHFFATHAYAAAKSAVSGFVKSVAAYYAPYGIRCNGILPGLVDTPMSARAMTDKKIMEFIQTKQPLDGGRAGIPADLDEAVLFFLSDASKFVTGQMLAVDGGWSVSEGQFGV